MYLGVDWYPEQWGLDMVEHDLDGIVGLGCDIVRIGDFAWDVMEPHDGHYDFSFFDEVISRIKARGLKVMMCVPTATMPRWLALRYPQAVAQDQDGTPRPYGGRRAYCYNSHDYRRKAKALATALARHYRDEPAIVAWQIDNEIGHEGSDMCWCASCHKQFIVYLRNRYGTIDSLNQRWGTRFWAQTYDRFEDIPLPRPALTAQNPALRLEWERFRSLSIAGFLEMLYKAVKTEAPQAYVLHDFSGGWWDKHFDPFAAASPLDGVAYNNYPVWGGQRHPQSPAEVAFALDSARGLKGANFWVTEQIMGAQGHDVIGYTPRPGQAVAWAWQALAHGCESLLFFRYRGYNRGAEQYCFGILNPDGQPKRRYHEARDFFRQAHALAGPLSSPIVSRTALVYDYDSAAAWRIQPQSDAMSYWHEAFVLYEQLWRRGIGTDVITADHDLAGYDVVLVPAMIVMDDAYKEKLKDYVSQGGTVVLTFRTAWKDKDDAIPMGQSMPAGLTALTGSFIDEQESLLTSQTRRVEGVTVKGTGLGSVFCEMLKTTTASAMIAWDGCAFGEYAAVTVNQYGKGRCFYLGTSLDAAMLDKVFDDVTKAWDVGPKGKSDTAEKVVRDGTVIAIDYNAYKVEIGSH